MGRVDYCHFLKRRPLKVFGNWLIAPLLVLFTTEFVQIVTLSWFFTRDLNKCDRFMVLEVQILPVKLQDYSVILWFRNYNFPQVFNPN